MFIPLRERIARHLCAVTKKHMVLAIFLTVISYTKHSNADLVPQRENGVEVTFNIKGDFDSALRSKLLAQSRIAETKSKLYYSRGRVRSLVKADTISFEAVLRSEGYYAARISPIYNEKPDTLAIEIEIEIGPRYHIAALDISLQALAQNEIIIENLRRNLAIKVGDPIQTAVVVAAETQLAQYLPTIGYPLATVGSRQVIIDHSTQSAHITYVFDTGPLLEFGELSYSGVTSVKPSFLNRLVPWDQGDTYDQNQVNEFRRRVNRTGLFSSSAINLETSDSQRLPLQFSGTEAPHQTLGIGASFSTSEGAGGDITWEHRNLFGSADRLNATLTVAELEQSLAFQFEKPHFLRLNQTFLANSGIEYLTTDAFDSRTISFDLGLQRRISKSIALTAGVEFDITEVQEEFNDQDFRTTALPIALSWDGSDDLLDPTQGARLSVRLTPASIRGDSDIEILQSDLSSSIYLPLDSAGQWVFAGRVRLGSIIGANTNQIPANRRFFAGGGGSIRGFGFQEVGPLDSQGIPFGGRSLATLGLETRWRLNDTIGLVPFVEGGNVYDETLPDFSDFRWGIGLGLRYYTAFGPLRLDVATPIDRENGDTAIQVYLSLGQSF
jgi:translocation and assembly module TamA